LNSDDQIKGTGIGLAFCRTVCERHGWRLDLSSEVGVGSTFSIVVPATSEKMRHGAPFRDDGR
jgi:signal transduction histidine kinase